MPPSSTWLSNLAMCIRLIAHDPSWGCSGWMTGAGFRGRRWSGSPRSVFVATSKQAPTLSFYPNWFKKKATSASGNMVRKPHKPMWLYRPRDVPSIVLDAVKSAGAPASCLPCWVRCLACWPLRGQSVVLVIDLAEGGDEIQWLKQLLEATRLEGLHSRGVVLDKGG